LLFYLGFWHGQSFSFCLSFAYLLFNRTREPSMKHLLFITPTRRLLGALAASAIGLGVLATTSGVAQAQGFPAKPITMIIPFPAGGSTDAAARMMGNAMAKQLGQPIVFDNVGGASGTIGMNKLARAAADGYTIGAGTIGTHVIVPALSRKPPYDAIGSFDAVGLVGSSPMMLAVKNGLPVKDFKDFIRYAKANKDKMSYGSAGIGSQAHYGCMMLLSSMGMDIQHVPYRGIAPAYTDLISGQIDFVCDQPSGILPHAQAGRIKALATLSNSKLRQMPELPTASSQGLADTNVRVWTGIFAPKGTPPDVIKRLNDAMAQAAKDPEVIKQATTMGLDLPVEFAASPGALSAMIVIGSRREGPILQARKEYLD
jgi:tripartite-type tricarboxylate transporter receptor subunit TctC